MLALATAGWLACFAVLARSGTWTTFAFVGAPLAVTALLVGAVPRALLRASPRKIEIGILAGLLMLTLTHAAFAAVASLVPEARTATARLAVLFEVSHLPVATRAGLIVVIASCEEILFRGALPVAHTGNKDRLLRGLSRADLLQIVIYATIYALATVTLGSVLLMSCAFMCGIVWGIMRAATGSLVVPILAHVVWDLGVLLLWPLVATP
jgi:membrane protease YdiL (CAAX protease family)